ncbi:MAG: hypothetical protein F6K30_21315 [Cyanothece sp. SIO2G6]|nr:hypothetical protein [Cyanothece sp. SIO2G6]
MTEFPTRQPPSAGQHPDPPIDVEFGHASSSSPQQSEMQQPSLSPAQPATSAKNLSPLFHFLLCWLALLVLTNPRIITPAALVGYAQSLVRIVYRLPLSQLSWQRPPAVTDSRIIRLRRAIIGQESGANYRAVNPHSGALGYGQVMPANVPVWTQQALGRSLTSQQFLNDPDAQIATIDYKLQQYWREAQAVTSKEDEIVRRVASKWYSGNPRLWNNTRPQFYKGHPYPSIANYTYSVLRRYRRQS